MNAINVNNERSFLIVEGERYQLSEIVAKNGRVTMKPIAPVVEAENVAKTIRKYDPNVALTICGIRELNPTQMELFDAWWNLFNED